MRAIALTDANGNSLIEDVPLTELKATSLDRRKNKVDVWSKKLNYTRDGNLNDLVKDNFFSLLANRLVLDGTPINTAVTYGRSVRGGLRMIRFNGKEYREHLGIIYVR
jgi:hypothetical protein